MFSIQIYYHQRGFDPQPKQGARISLSCVAFLAK